MGSSQPLESLKIKTVASLSRDMWATTPTSLLKKNFTYSSIFKAYFMKDFAAAKASLVFIKNICSSSCSLIFFKIGVLKNFAMFTGKHLCWSLFSLKLQVFSVTDDRKSLCDRRKTLSNGHRYRHYLDIATSFISFNSFANSSKINFAII